MAERGLSISSSKALAIIRRTDDNGVLEDCVKTRMSGSNNVISLYKWRQKPRKDPAVLVDGKTLVTTRLFVFYGATLVSSAIIAQEWVKV